MGKFILFLIPIPVHLINFIAKCASIILNLIYILTVLCKRNVDHRFIGSITAHERKLMSYLLIEIYLIEVVE